MCVKCCWLSSHKIKVVLANRKPILICQSHQKMLNEGWFLYDKFNSRIINICIFRCARWTEISYNLFILPQLLFGPSQENDATRLLVALSRLDLQIYILVLVYRPPTTNSSIWLRFMVNYRHTKKIFVQLIIVLLGQN